MGSVNEREFKARAQLLGATMFRESEMYHTFHFLGEKIEYAVLLDRKNKKNKIVPVSGDKSISSVSMEMSEIFKKRKLPHGGNASYFRNRLIGKNDIMNFIALESISKTLVVVFAGLLFSLMAVFISNYLTGSAIISVFNFDYVETSFLVGLAVFIVSVAVLAKIIFKKE